MIDLHIHTSYSSDGVYKPEEILKMAKEKGIKAMSFTDHNEVAANLDACHLARKYEIKYIPGVEFNSFWKGRDVHVLGYYLDYSSAKIKEFLENLRRKKQEQTVERVKKLKELGFLITLEDVIEETKGRPATGVSFLKAILKIDENLKDERLFSYIRGEKSRSPYMNFYNDYLTPGKPAFVELKDAPTEEVIKLINACYGIPVVAHPKDLNEKELAELKEMGAKGIEVYSSYHTTEQKLYYRDLAMRLEMIVTAGSDFHGEEIKKDVKLGSVGAVDENIIEDMEKQYRKLYGKEPYSL